MNFDVIEKKWQDKWEKNKIFSVKEDSKKEKCYVLEMFPYPSASGLHMGHALNYTIGDVYARFKRMKGFNVFYPMGFDALGLPAENAAIEAGEHPKSFTEKAIENYTRQMKELGLSYDWGRTLQTVSPDYYKWNQYFFLKFLEKGLVYRKKAPVNWCPDCNTVLANEQVQNGKCWRHEDTEVEIRHLEQWYIKTTQYAEELLSELESLDWPDKIKAMQKNWIGKSYGTSIKFEVNSEDWEIFTTRPDTLYGVTFMVVAAQHPKLMSLVTDEQKKEVEAFIKKIRTVSQKSIKEVEELEKEGAFTGSYAKHPITGDKIPIHTGNFVLAEYGSGMVMAVPAHDQRDFEFAKKYEIPIEIVVNPENKELSLKDMKRAFTGEGVLVNSEEFDGWKSEDAKEGITKKLKDVKKGNKTVNYKLRDWGFSRQRYWGTPIPIINCSTCGLVPVSEKDLPVVLPVDVKFGEGNPLETNQDWLNTKCPKCEGDAKREPDTMDTFFDSSWYYLRYCDNNNDDKPFEKSKMEYWMPVDVYIGGAEHACMHLIYARFFTKALRDLGYLNFDEPFKKLLNQGMLNGPDGKKMSKSKGNVINPDEVSKNYGMDTARFFLLSLATPEKDRDWSKDGVEGTLRFMKKVINFFENTEKNKKTKLTPKIEHKVNLAIKEVTKNINSLKYNIAIIKIREFFDFVSKEEVGKDTLEVFIKLISPFCPHISEELWESLGNKTYVSLESWPEYDESKINREVEFAEELTEQVKEDIREVIKLTGKQPHLVKILVSQEWKYKFVKILKEEIDKGNRDFKKILLAIPDDMKLHMQEITKLIPKILKDESKIPNVITSEDKEFDIVSSFKEELEREFKTKIEVVKADKSKEPKAKQSFPSKPGIVLS